jgi:hypothetical protein
MTMTSIMRGIMLLFCQSVVATSCICARHRRTVFGILSTLCLKCCLSIFFWHVQPGATDSHQLPLSWVTWFLDHTAPHVMAKRCNHKLRELCCCFCLFVVPMSRSNSNHLHYHRQWPLAHLECRRSGQLELGSKACLVAAIPDERGCDNHP